MFGIRLAIALGWIAFWGYWLVAAFSSKRGRVAWSRELRIRVVLVAMVIVLARIGVLRWHRLNNNAWFGGLGLALELAGLAFAVWARLHLGRNWGMPMTRKREPELVRTGPYRLVRHPIYTGLVVALFGTAVALSWVVLVAVLVVGCYFAYSADVEERTLTEQFPDAYLAYRQHTKRFLPYLF